MNTFRGKSDMLQFCDIWSPRHFGREVMDKYKDLGFNVESCTKIFPGKNYVDMKFLKKFHPEVKIFGVAEISQVPMINSCGK